MGMRNRAKEIVAARGITAYRFWLDTGIGRNTAFDLYHRSERYPSAEVMATICRTYGLTPSDVVEYVPDETEAA
jgi:DNA-binding Xre family transcriptional regulator